VGCRLPRLRRSGTGAPSSSSESTPARFVAEVDPKFSFDPGGLSLPFRFPKGLLDASKHIRSKVEADGSDRRDVELDVDLAPDGAGTRTEGTGRVR